MVVELERDADDIIAFALEDRGYNGGIDAAGHGDDDTGFLRALWKIERVHLVPAGGFKALL
jgi:hypothetical protein